MQLVRCNNGHYYDSEKHSSCPHCGIQNLDIDIQKTMPLGAVNSQINKTQARTAGMEAASQDEGKTVGIYQKKLGIDPVVGWVVCIEGPDKGKDYRIRSERNFIGRSQNMDICLENDNMVSRENHAIISYNPKKNSFRLIPGDGKGLVYLNDEEVFIPTILNSYDIIELGETKLMFVPFCCERFVWKKEEAGNE